MSSARRAALETKRGKLTYGEHVEFMRAGLTIAARGGAKIWTMREAWMPSPCTCQAVGQQGCIRHRQQDAMNAQMTEGADPDGFAVFGQFPYGWLTDVVRLKLLGDVARQDILHVCSGTLSEHERWTVDIRPSAKPAVIAKGQALPFLEASFAAVLLDPPYTRGVRAQSLSVRVSAAVASPQGSRSSREAKRTNWTPPHRGAHYASWL